MHIKNFLFSLAYILALCSLGSPIHDNLATKSIGFSESSDSLPYDAEVEYLEFTGTQRILTDIPPKVYDRSLKTSISYQLTSTVGRQLSGCGASYFEFCSNAAFVQGDGSCPADLNQHILDFTGWDTSSSRVLYDGQKIRANGFVLSTDTSAHFTFGSLKANSQSNALKAKVYSLSMEYQDGTKLLDWIPVRFTNENGETEGAMYDLVSQSLFTNQGTGSFVIGPDVE